MKQKQTFAPKICQKCKTEFIPSWGTVRYCSDVCSGTEMHTCAQCGIEFRRKRQTRGLYCSRDCKKASQAWEVGRTMPSSRGYTLVVVPRGTPGAFSSTEGALWANPLMFQHRYVMQTALGRPLADDEHVHHINGIRTDNRLDNLELWRKVHPSGVRADGGHCPGCTCQK